MSTIDQIGTVVHFERTTSQQILAQKLSQQGTFEDHASTAVHAPHCTLSLSLLLSVSIPIVEGKKSVFCELAASPLDEALPRRILVQRHDWSPRTSVVSLLTAGRNDSEELPAQRKNCHGLQANYTAYLCGC